MRKKGEEGRKRKKRKGEAEMGKRARNMACGELIAGANFDHVIFFLAISNAISTQKGRKRGEGKGKGEKKEKGKSGREKLRL